jgi:hypothetical protein
MLIILSTAQINHYVTPNQLAAAEVCGRHQRAYVRKHPAGWEAKWVEVRTATWCLDGTQEDLEAAKAFAKVNGDMVWVHSRFDELDAAHANTYSRALCATAL